MCVIRSFESSHKETPKNYVWNGLRMTHTHTVNAAVTQKCEEQVGRTTAKFTLSYGKSKQFTESKWPFQTTFQNKCQLCKKKCKVTSEVLWIHQTKYSGISTFMIICASSPQHWSR
jgi:hypothetical protein